MDELKRQVSQWRQSVPDAERGALMKLRDIWNGGCIGLEEYQSEK